MHNQLGTTTLRRRRLKDGSYQYKIAGEQFDFTRGNPAIDAGYGVEDYGKKHGRFVPFWGEYLMKLVLPELVESGEFLTTNSVKPKENLNNYGKPFDVIGEYVDEREMYIEDKIISDLKRIK